MTAGTAAGPGWWRGLALLVISGSLLGCTGAPMGTASPATTAGAAIGTSSPTPSSSASAAPTPSASPNVPTPEPTASPDLRPTVGDSFAILPLAPPPGIDPGIACTGSISDQDPLAFVQLHSADGTVLRDYADVAHPRTVCTGWGTLIDAHHLLTFAELDDSSHGYAIVDIPTVRYRWFHLPTSTFEPELLAVSPDLTQIVWRALQAGPGGADVIHVTTVGGDHVVAQLPDTNQGRCSAPSDSGNSAFTRSGSAFFVLDEPLPEVSLIVRKPGKTVLSMIGTATAPLSSRPLKVLWSPASESLFWTQKGNVWRWTQSGGAAVYLAGVTWESATISPDGTHLAYWLTNAAGTPDTYMVDLANDGAPVRIGAGHRGEPRFLNNRQLFYRPEAFDGGCGGSPGPRPLIYDLKTGTEATSVLDFVGSAWPMTDTGG